MNQEKTHSTVILLLEEQSAKRNEFIKEWLNESPFVTNESTDMWEALEDMADFTVRSRPDVVLLEVASLKNDYLALKNMMQDFDGGNFPILALSDSGKVVNDKNCFEGNLAEVKAQITKVLPGAFAKTAPAV